MTITRNIRTPIMHRAVEANGLVFVGGTIADDTSVSMGEQTRNILGKIAGYLREAGSDTSKVVSALQGSDVKSVLFIDGDQEVQVTKDDGRRVTFYSWETT